MGEAKRKVLARQKETVALDTFGGRIHVEPRFPIRGFSRGIDRREFGGQVEGIGCLPKAFHPDALWHGHSEIENRLSCFSRDIGGLGEQLVAQGLQRMLHGSGR